MQGKLRARPFGNSLENQDVAEIIRFRKSLTLMGGWKALADGNHSWFELITTRFRAHWWSCMLALLSLLNTSDPLGSVWEDVYTMSIVKPSVWSRLGQVKGAMYTGVKRPTYDGSVGV